MTQILGRVRLHSLVIYMPVKNIGGQGIGKQLLSLFKEEALRQGAGRLKLCVMAINTNALNMYKSQGFKITTYCMEQEI